VKKGATRFPDDEGLSWRGNRSHFGLKYYDKAREMRLLGSALRVEISLRGRLKSKCARVKPEACRTVAGGNTPGMHPKK
jgi:hypothetical protein